MTHIPLYDLLTVRQVAQITQKSEGGVRGLVRKGKLAALREGGKLLIKAESLSDYMRTLPHPPEVMAAMYDARRILAFEKQLLNSSPSLRAFGLGGVIGDPFITHLLKPAVPVCADILSAVKARDYKGVEQGAAELWRLRTDYAMLYASMAAPRVKGGKVQERPEYVMPPLFPDTGEGGAE